MRRRVRRSPTGLPSSQPSPDDGLRRPSSSFTAVVLPAPLGPRKPNTSPRGTVIDRPARATVCPNLLVSSTVFTAGGPAAPPPGDAPSGFSAPPGTRVATPPCSPPIPRLGVPGRGHPPNTPLLRGAPAGLRP